MPKSTHSRRANARPSAEVVRSDQGTDPQILAQADAVLKTPVRRDPMTDREAFLRALQSGDDARIEAAWPGAIVAKGMLADKVIAYHNDGDYSITDRGLAELATDEPSSQEEYANEVLDERYRAGALTEGATVVEIRAELGTTCACGCGAGVTPKRVFRQGHDQRLIGILAEATAGGKEIGHWSGGTLVTGSPRTYGARVLADGGCYKLDSAIKRAQEQWQAHQARLTAKGARAKRLTAKAARVSQTPMLKSVPAGPALGDEVKVRIGRHEYFARVHGMSQAGKVTAVEYTVKSSGAKKVAFEGKFELLTD